MRINLFVNQTFLEIQFVAVTVPSSELSVLTRVKLSGVYSIVMIFPIR